MGACICEVVMSAGMQTTQLSESFNACLKGYLKSDLHLPEFFTHFARILCDKRYKELEAEYDLLFRTVHCKMEASILLHARKVYTKDIFKVFEAQFEKSLKSSTTKCVSDGEKFVFTVVTDGFFKEKLVKREGELTVSCSCRMFETVGVLCSHCIKVMNEGRETTLIKKIPEQYILARWTKNARVGNVVQDMHGQEIVENPKLKQTSRYRSLCSKFVRLASRASESERTFEAVNVEADNLVKLVEDMLHVEINGNKEVEGEAQTLLVDSSNDLTVPNAKGFKKRESTHRGKRRTKGGFEVQLSKSKKKTQQVNMRSPMMGGNDRHMSVFFQPYNIEGHQMNLSNQITWTPQPHQEFPRPISQEFDQPNTKEFSFAQDLDKSSQ